MSEDVIKELIRTGKLTQEAADNARVKVDKTLRACAFTLHTLMCNKGHEENPEMLHQLGTGKCMWYVEQSLELMWDAPAHNFWLGRTLEVMKELEITDSEAMKEFLQKFTEVTTGVSDLIAWYPKSFRLLEEVAKT